MSGKPDRYFETLNSYLHRGFPAYLDVSRYCFNSKCKGLILPMGAKIQGNYKWFLR